MDDPFGATWRLAAKQTAAWIDVPLTAVHEWFSVGGGYPLVEEDGLP